MKHFELTDSNQKLITEEFNETGLYNYVELRLIGVAKAKEVIKVAKPGDMAKHFGHLPDDVVAVVVYEEAFDLLDEHNKRMIVKDALNVISYDDEKDKIKIGVPQIVVTLNGREKYGDELVNAAESAVYAIIEIEEEKERIKEEERTRKAAARPPKKK